MDNNLVKENDKLNVQKEELDDMLERLNIINQRLSVKHTGAQDFELCNQKKELKEKISKQKVIVSELETKVKTLKNNILELNDIYPKTQFYISNAYNIRYMNYCNCIKDKLSLTDFKLNIIPFNDLMKNLEGANERIIK